MAKSTRLVRFTKYGKKRHRQIKQVWLASVNKVYDLLPGGKRGKNPIWAIDLTSVRDLTRRQFSVLVRL